MAGGQDGGGAIARRSAFVVVAVLAAIGTMALAAPANAKRADLTVAKVIKPHPPGTNPGGALFVRSNVANRGEARAKRSRVAYSLSKTRKRRGDDISLRTKGREHGHRVPALRPADRDGGGMAAIVPRRIEPGIYRLIACADAGNRVAETRRHNNCGSSARRVAIHNDPSGVAGGEALGAAQSSPIDEYFPEQWRGDIGFQYKHLGDCPFSFHGQGGSDCTWVRTPKFDPTARFFQDFTKYRNDYKNGDIFGLFYCPSDHRFPFEVALGFDPMWSEDSGDGHAFTRTVSGTKYNVIRNDPGDREMYSYTGGGGQPGYVYFDIPVTQDFLNTSKYFNGGAWYLCSDKAANSYWP